MLVNYHIGRLVLISLCIGDLVRLVLGGVRFAGWSTTCCKRNTTQNQPHQISNTQRTENKTTDVVIHQHSRKLLKMDILMSETCWAHNKWNQIASDIKLVFHSSTIAMMHSPINIRFTYLYLCKHPEQCFPNVFARGNLLASKNNHESLHPCWCKYRTSRWRVTEIKNMYLRTDLDGYGYLTLTYITIQCMIWH